MSLTLMMTMMFCQATHINFICPMRFDNFPLDTQTCKFQVRSCDVQMVEFCLTSGRVLLIRYGQDDLHTDQQGARLRQDRALGGPGLCGESKEDITKHNFPGKSQVRFPRVRFFGMEVSVQFCKLDFPS